MSHPRVAYQHASETRAAEALELEGRARRVEIARISAFIVGAVAGLLRNDLPIPPVFPTSIALFTGVAFVALVIHHRRLRGELRRVRAAGALAKMGLARIDRDWKSLAAAFEDVGYEDPLLRSPGPDDEQHPYATDLDLFGPASVRALLGPTPTPTGVEHLRRWLSEPSTPEAVRRRQSAVRALSKDDAARETLAIESLLIDSAGAPAWNRFLEWTRFPTPIGGAGGVPSWSSPVSFALPGFTGVLFALWLPAIVPAWSWILPLAVQTLLAWRWGQTLSPYFDMASGRSRGIRRHHALCAAWEAYETSEPTLRALLKRLQDEDGRTTSESIRVLERLLDRVESRASMFQPVLSFGLMSDVHLAHALERWRTRSGVHINDWFQALGELEAIAALATLAHEQPDWTFPEVADGEPAFGAKQIGHPLLSDAVRRPSDVVVDGAGRFLLVTGSNMSGKSTLLRSIGLAAVMGQAGSVVCASDASMSSLRVFTSMRVHDSLTGGVSLFMAELLRLKQLVDAADAGNGEARPLLYLIDEVLQGTNSEERRVAARRIIAHLLDANAIGAVTTHDLAMHEDEALGPGATKVHFRETVDDASEEVLTFDYVLRPGLATSRNALKLLSIVGLDDSAK
ncbi:MAG: MutS-related protein [Longimicrobiales bacterium]